MLRFYAFHHRLFGFSSLLLTVVVLDSRDLLARNKPMHWEFEIKRAYKMRVRNTVKQQNKKKVSWSVAM